MAQSISIQGLSAADATELDLSSPVAIQQPNKDAFNKLSLSDVKKVIYATCSTASATSGKIAVLSNFKSLTMAQGLQIVVIFENANTADNVSLKLQDSEQNDISAYINVIALGSALLQLGNGSIKANSRMVLDYDGTYWNAHTEIVSDVNGIVTYANGKTIDSTPTLNSTNLITSGGVKSAYDTLDGEISDLDDSKQDNLTFDNAPTSGSSNPVTSSGIRSAIDSLSAASFNTATCDTASATQNKEITISDFNLSSGALLGITFTNGNTYGDTTLSTPTYPTLTVNSGTAYPICDSRGNYAGTGAWNDGDYIELRFTGDKFVIINSDIRQSVSGTSGYTIYSNGKIVQWGKQAPLSSSYQLNYKISFPKTLTALTQFQCQSDRIASYSSSSTTADKNYVNLITGKINRLTTSGFYINYLESTSNDNRVNIYWSVEGFI